MLNSPTPLRLPPELLHNIFDNLHPSDSEWTASWPKAQEVRQPLSTCTLVSRSWHPVAREHLFRDIVYSFHASEPWGSHMPSIDPEKPRWVATDSLPHPVGNGIEHLPCKKRLYWFLHFIQYCPTAIRSSIRKLRLAHYPIPLEEHSRRFSEIWAVQEEQDMTDPYELESLVSRLPQLVHLQLWNVFTRPPRVTYSLVPLISVQSVRLAYAYYTMPISQVCTLLSYLGEIRDLTIHSLPGTDYQGRATVGRYVPAGPIGHIGLDQLAANFPSSISLDIRSLTILMSQSPPPINAFTELVRRSPSTNNLRMLSVDSTGADTSTMVKCIDLLRTSNLGRQLEHLTLTTNVSSLGNSILDLSNMRNLKELVVGGYFMFDEAASDPSLEMRGAVKLFRTTVLSPKANPNLHKISFIFGRRSGTPQATNDPWWEDDRLQRELAGFEAHFINFIQIFKLPGIPLKCLDVDRDVHSEPADASLLQAIRDIIPKVFVRLARDGLIIMDDDTPAAA